MPDTMAVREPGACETRFRGVELGDGDGRPCGELMRSPAWECEGTLWRFSIVSSMAEGYMFPCPTLPALSPRLSLLSLTLTQGRALSLTPLALLER